MLRTYIESLRRRPWLPPFGPDRVTTPVLFERPAIALLLWLPRRERALPEHGNAFGSPLYDTVQALSYFAKRSIDRRGAASEGVGKVFSSHAHRSLPKSCAILMILIAALAGSLTEGISPAPRLPIPERRRAARRQEPWPPSLRASYLSSLSTSISQWPLSPARMFLNASSRLGTALVTRGRSVAVHIWRGLKA